MKTTLRFFTRNNCRNTRGCLLIILMPILLISLYLIIIGLGVTTMGLFHDHDYNFKTGICTGGLFCSTNGQAMCSSADSFHFYIGCAGIGLIDLIVLVQCSFAIFIFCLVIGMCLKPFCGYIIKECHESSLEVNGFQEALVVNHDIESNIVSERNTELTLLESLGS